MPRFPGKLYEHLVLQKLKELLRTGSLSERQYEFKEGRKAIDAIKDVLKIARDSAARMLKTFTW